MNKDTMLIGLLLLVPAFCTLVYLLVKDLSKIDLAPGAMAISLVAVMAVFGVVLIAIGSSVNGSQETSQRRPRQRRSTTRG